MPLSTLIARHSARPPGMLGFSSRQALIASGRAGRGFRAYPQEQIERGCRDAGFGIERIDAAARQGGGEVYALRALGWP